MTTLFLLSELPGAHQYSSYDSTEMNTLITGNMNCMTFIHASNMRPNCNGLGN